MTTRDHVAQLVFVTLAGVVALGFASQVSMVACGTSLFPKCDDPMHPCPNVEPDYPVGWVPDASIDRQVDLRDVGHE
jgi:hypothetical protein